MDKRIGRPPNTVISAEFPKCKRLQTEMIQATSEEKTTFSDFNTFIFNKPQSYHSSNEKLLLQNEKNCNNNYHHLQYIQQQNNTLPEINMQQYKNKNNMNNNNNCNNCNSNNSSSSCNNNNNNNNNHNIIESYRPTYGAYLTNSLPRGPYLQYKCKDLPKSSIGVYTNNNDNNSNNTISNRHNLAFHQNHEQPTITTLTSNNNEQQQHEQLIQHDKKQYENQSNMNARNWKFQDNNNANGSNNNESNEFQIQNIKNRDNFFENEIENQAKYVAINSKELIKKYEQNIENNYGNTKNSICKNIPPAKPPRLYLQQYDRTNNYNKQKPQQLLQNTSSLYQQQSQQPQQNNVKQHSETDFNIPVSQNINCKSQQNPRSSQNNDFQKRYHYEHILSKNREQLLQTEHQLQNNMNSKNQIQRPTTTIQRPLRQPQINFNSYNQQHLQHQQYHPGSGIEKQSNMENIIKNNNQNMADIYITEPTDQIYFNKNLIISQSSGLLAIATPANITDEQLKAQYHTIPNKSNNEKLLEGLSVKDIMEPTTDKNNEISKIEGNFLNDKSQFYECYEPQKKINFYSQPKNNKNIRAEPNNIRTQHMTEQEIKLQYFLDTNKILQQQQPTAKTTTGNVVKSVPKTNIYNSYQYITGVQNIQHQKQVVHKQQEQRKISEISTGNDLLTVCHPKKLVTGNNTDDNNKLLYRNIDGLLNINSNRNYFKFPSQSHPNEINSCSSSRVSYDNVVVGVPLSPLPMMGVSVGITGRKRIQSEIKYVTLADVMSTKSGKLSEIEMWALLCQSVQALQDLFLSDTPSTTKILPLVKSSTIQITSRGRIVFSLTSTSQYCFPPNEALTHNEAVYFDITAHLSPEYLNSIGKKITFLETDVEKMWIYSLGRTLRSTMENNYRLTVLNRNEMSNTVSKFYKDDINDNGKRSSTSIAGIPKLEHVIKCMCEEHLQQRASLMYLLDVISKYFRSQFQIKPFSHIVMEIFKDVAYKLEKLKNPHYQIEVEKSEETDSGRSSDNCIEFLSYKTNRLHNLKVVKEKANSNPYGDFDKCGTIGFAGIKTLQAKKEPKQIPQLIVRRRNRETIKKRNLRRNTIDVNAFDLEKASKIIQEQDKIDKNYLNTSRSTNYLDKILTTEEDFNNKIDKIRLSDGFLIADVNKLKLEDNLNNKISHIFNRKEKSEQNLIKSHSEESFLCSPTNDIKGPEFILKSNCPHRSIKLNKSKDVPPQTVHVILLNGQSLHIKCNYTTTTIKDIFKAVIESEDYLENFYLSLCALIGGDFVFLPSDLKIYKVAPQNWLNASSNKKYSGSLCSVFFTLFLRIKFYLPNLKGVSSLQTRHMLYLQLRKNILEKLILCSDDDLIVLGGLALQAEMGDYQKSMEYLDYFKVSHYLPEDVYCRNKEITKNLRNSHYCRKGMNCKEAEYNFVKYVQEMKEYGFHLYSANWVLNESTFIKIYLGISLGGITFFERYCDQTTYPTEDKLLLLQNSNNLRKNNSYKYLLKHFEWLEIENLCFSKHILCIAVRKLESLKAKDNNKIKFKLRMDDKKSYFAFSLASEHHQFYLKLRNSFASFRSISNELNIPITSMDNLKINTETKQKSSAGKETMKIISLSSSSSSTSDICKSCNDNCIKSQKRCSKIKIENPYSSIPLASSSSTSISITSASSSPNNNVSLLEKNKNNTSNCPYHQQQEQTHQDLITSKPAIKATTTTKCNVHNVKPSKKSMLNDNRLLKFKEKFLRRTKSTAAGLEMNLKSKFKKDKKQNNSTENLSEFNKNDCDCSCKVDPTMTITQKDEATKEEYQNKENESPKNRLTDIELLQIKEKELQSQQKQNELVTSVDSSIEVLSSADFNMSSTSSSTGVKVCSPNRNKVKMGTRVFSSQFLNKSYDNIYDRFKQFNNKTSINTKDIVPLSMVPRPLPTPSTTNLTTNTIEDDISEIDGGIYDTIDYKRDTKNCRKNISEFNGRQFDFVDVAEDDDNNENDNDNISVILSNKQHPNQDDSNCSIYSDVYCKVNKIYSTTNKCSISPIKSPSSLYEQHQHQHHQHQHQQQQQQQEQKQSHQQQHNNNIRASSEQAYVIQSNISNDSHNNNFSINNDTISDSLLERFNNISNTSTSGPERLLRKVTVIKEITTLLPPSLKEEENVNYKNSESCTKQIIQPVDSGSIVKYSTFSPSKVKTLLRSFSNIDCIRDQNNPRNKLYSADMEKSNLDDVKIHPQAKNIYQKLTSNDNLQDYTLGISIVQGSNDNNVYVKDLIKNGPGDKAGILIGDQIIAVNGTSLLNLSYMESLRLLQNTERVVDLIISQIILTASTTIENSNNNYSNKNQWKDDFLQQSKNISYLRDKIFHQDKPIRDYHTPNFAIDDGHGNYRNGNSNFEEYNREPSSGRCDNISYNTMLTENQNKDINPDNIRKNNKCSWKQKIDDKEEGEVEEEEDDEGRMINENITLSMSNVCVTNFEQSRENYRIRRKSGLGGVSSGNLINKKNSTHGSKKILDSNMSRSLPDIPKVISVLPNEAPLCGETVEYATVLRKSQRRTSNHPRKYIGPMRYPVTPKKVYITTGTINKHNQQNQLSIKEHTQQVLI